MVPETAEMVQVPSPELVATPYVPTEFPITATFTSEELQSLWKLRFACYRPCRSLGLRISA